MRTSIFSIIMCVALAGCVGDPFSSAPATSGTGGAGGRDTTSSTSTISTGSSGGETSSSSSETTSVGPGGAGGASASSSSNSSGGGGSGDCSPNDEKWCGEACVLTSNPDYGCSDQSCDPCSVAHATASCSGGQCDIGACQLGFDDCQNGAQDGCETPTSADPQNCGACDNQCDGDQVCQGGQCLNTCGSQPIPNVGVVLCWELTSQWLNDGTYGGIQSSVGVPATNQPGDPITSGCVSLQPATVNNSTDPSVRCVLGAHAPGTEIYLGLKAYTNNAPNPPPFFTHLCDPGPPGAINKCRGPFKVYVNGVLKGSYTPPNAAAPFSYFDPGGGIPMQLKLTVP